MSRKIKYGKSLLVLAWVVSLVVAIVASCLITRQVTKGEEPAGGATLAPVTTAMLYDFAMKDSVYADTDEIRQLVEITKESELVTWNEEGTKVLMLSWNRHPERYLSGESYTLSGGEIWTFTDQEILKWYADGGKNAEDMVLRLEQLIGLPEDSGYTHVSAFWVEPHELIRPAYNPDISKQVGEADLKGASLGEYEAWFEGNILWSYFDSAYPWTRLGYTYDWAAGSGEYGLSEFIILPQSEVEVAFTVSTEAFLDMLKANHIPVR